MDSSTVTDPESLPIFSDPGRRTGAALAGLTTRPAIRKQLWHFLRWSTGIGRWSRTSGGLQGSNSASQLITDKSEHELRIAGRPSRVCSFDNGDDLERLAVDGAVELEVGRPHPVRPIRDRSGWRCDDPGRGSVSVLASPVPMTRLWCLGIRSGAAVIRLALDADRDVAALKDPVDRIELPPGCPRYRQPSMSARNPQDSRTGLERAVLLRP